MNATSPLPLVAVDIGNTRVKLGLFDALAGSPLPEPAKTLLVDLDEAPPDAIADWLGDLSVRDISWWIGSVARDRAGRLVAWLRDRDVARITMIAASDLPLSVAVPQPDRVGIDRLLDAVAVNRLRAADEPAIIVDLGTAIKVDLVSHEGAFQGGAILPGIRTSARALHQFTDLLPLIDMSTLEHAPPALGTSTIEAMRAGLFWGGLGSVRELIRQISVGLPRSPRVILTGGAAPSIAPLLSDTAQYVPHLTLSGIALAATSQP